MAEVRSNNVEEVIRGWRCSIEIRPIHEKLRVGIASSYAHAQFLMYQTDLQLSQVLHSPPRPA